MSKKKFDFQIHVRKLVDIVWMICLISSALFLDAGFANAAPLKVPSSAAYTGCNSVTGIDSSECQALEALYVSAAGANWVDNTDWLQTDTPCAWFGVSCSGGHVTSIGLSENNLVGAIPTQIGQLPYLEVLDLSGNTLTGTIPSSIGSLTNLNELWLNENQLKGPLPDEITLLTNLTKLVLNHNSISWTLPVNIGNLANLTYFTINNNPFDPADGEIPASFVNLTNLTFLRLACGLASTDQAVIDFVYQKWPAWPNNQCEPTITIHTPKMYSLITLAGWPSPNTFTITVDDPATPDITEDYTRTTDMTQIKLVDFPLEIGFTVTVTDGTTTRSAVVSSQTIQNVDLLTGMVNGHTASTPPLTVQAVCNNVTYTRYAFPDPNGDWNVDFSAAGSQVEEQTTVSLNYDCFVFAVQNYADGNKSKYGWPFRDPFSQSDPMSDLISAERWPVGTHLSLIVDDPDNGIGADYSPPTIVVQQTDINDKGVTNLLFDLGDYDLDIADHVTILAGVDQDHPDMYQISYTIANLDVTSVDLYEDKVYGTTDPGGEISMYVSNNAYITYAVRHTIADLNGNWFVDFSVIPPNGTPAEQTVFDLTEQSKIGADGGDDGHTTIGWPVQKTRTVDDQGSSVFTDNAELVVPSGAIETNTEFTVTETGGGFQVATNQDSLDTVATVTIEPEGTTFGQPATVTLEWPDADNDGIVDNTTINEADIHVSKDGVIIAGPCSSDSNCDQALNKYSVQVSSLSYFTLGSPSDNHEPVVGSDTLFVRDNAPNGTSVGIVTYSDQDAGQSHTCSIYNGNVDNAFAIDPSTCEISVNDASVIDVNVLPSYALKVRVTDDGTPARFGEATITINIDGVSPSISSITRASTSPTSAPSVDFTVTFSEDVQNVDSTDFILNPAGAPSGSSVISVTPISDSIYTVTVNTGTSYGSLRLDIPVTADIEDLAGNPLAGLPFTSGEVYIKTATVNLLSIGANDGWILESTETSLTGGSLDSTATTFLLGDDASDRQYRAILHFDTSSLPDSAVITSAILQIRRHSTVGSNPFTILGALRADLRKISFGTAALQLTDFRVAANKNNVAVFSTTPVSNWYTGTLTAIGRYYINRTGSTQFKIYFTLDDNDDMGADYMRFFSGNAGAVSRPRLVIQYYIP